MTDPNTAKCDDCDAAILQHAVHVCEPPIIPSVERIVTFRKDVPVHDVLRAMCGARVDGVEVATMEEG